MAGRPKGINAKCLGNGCRSNANIKFKYACCNNRDCEEYVSHLDAECVQLFVEEVRLDPKSETAKDYYKAVKDAWVITQKSAALAAKRILFFSAEC